MILQLGVFEGKKMIKPDKLKKGNGRMIAKSGITEFWLLQFNRAVYDTNPLSPILKGEEN